MAYTCGWGSLQVRFKINFLEPCWVCAPLRNVIPSILLIFVQRPFLLIVYKFVLRRVVFNCIQEIFQHYFLLQFYLFFYSNLISFQIYTFYPFHYFIESQKVWKKPKYNSLRNKCLACNIYYIYIVNYLYKIYIYIYMYININVYLYIIYTVYILHIQFIYIYITLDNETKLEQVNEVGSQCELFSWLDSSVGQSV